MMAAIAVSILRISCIYSDSNIDLQGNHGFMAFYKITVWLLTFFVVGIWQIIIFILALVNRSKTLNACNEANPSTQDYNSTQNANVTIEGYTTTLLGVNMGETYGVANCDQAVQAGIIGIAVLLFVGGIFSVNTQLVKYILINI